MLKTADGMTTRLLWLRSRAFTLVELLVVIGIITLLASLLLPTLSRAKSAAHKAKCSSNLRQIALANAMYVSDSGAFPLFFDFAGPEYHFWTDRIQPYLASRWEDPVYRCPGYPNKNTPLIPRDRFHIMPKGSYDMNSSGTFLNKFRGMGIGWSEWTIDNVTPVKESQVVSPSDMIAYGDSLIGVGVVYAWSQLDFSEYHMNSGIRRIKEAKAEAKRHTGAFITTFIDGHVESLNTNEIFGLSDRTLKRWNRDNKPHKGSWKDLN